MGISTHLGTTIPGLLMLMTGFATAGFFSGRLAVLTAFVLVLGGLGGVLWGKRKRR